MASESSEDVHEPVVAEPVANDETGPTPALAAWPMWVVGVSVCAVIASAIQIGTGASDRGFFVITLCLATVSIAAWLDAATRKIPNSLTYPAILIGLAINLFLAPGVGVFVSEDAAVWFGATTPTDGALGFALCAVIGIVSFIVGGIGGGDTKLLGAMGAMLGFAACLPVLFNALVIAAIVGIVNWALAGQLVSRVQVVALSLLAFASAKSGERPEAYPFAKTEAPFGVSLLGGLILAQFVALHRVVLGVL